MLLILIARSRDQEQDQDQDQDQDAAVRGYPPAQSMALAPGDLLALVTDGFVEWARSASGDGRREQFGMDRLRDSLRRHARLLTMVLIRRE